MDLIKDDGSILGMGSGTVTPYLKHLDDLECTKITDTKICSIPCLFCPQSKTIYRMEMTATDKALEGLTLKIFNKSTGQFSSTL
jgi:hypothetical protein